MAAGPAHAPGRAGLEDPEGGRTIREALRMVSITSVVHAFPEQGPGRPGSDGVVEKPDLAKVAKEAPRTSATPDRPRRGRASRLQSIACMRAEEIGKVEARYK